MDINVREEGTLVLFTPTTQAARQWWLDHVAEGISIGTDAEPTHIVEHRYADDIIVGAEAYGFTVTVGRA